MPRLIFSSEQQYFDFLLFKFKNKYFVVDRLQLSDEDTVREVKKFLAAKILKSASDIHVCFEKQELR